MGSNLGWVAFFGRATGASSWGHSTRDRGGFAQDCVSFAPPCGEFALHCASLTQDRKLNTPHCVFFAQGGVFNTQGISLNI